jgi:putative ABC transport system permease protein
MLTPPKLAQRLLIRFLRNDLAEEVHGDLEEKFYQDLKNKSTLKVKINYWYQVLNYLRPFALRKSKARHLNQYDMFQSYFKIGWRNLAKNKGYSLINIGGLALGMAVAMLIGLWLHDELSFNKRFSNYDRIVRVMQHQTVDGSISSQTSLPMPLGNALRETYDNDFTHLSLSSWTDEHILSFGDKNITQSGNFVEAAFPQIFSLNMIAGERDGLKDPHSIMLSASASSALFGALNPIGQSLRMDNSLDVKVTGVYEDFPINSSLNELALLSSWELYITTEEWLKRAQEQWGNNSFQLFGQLASHGNAYRVSERIKNIKYKLAESERDFNPKIFLFPMSQWHLYSKWDGNGQNIGGRIQTIWLFGTIGVFVLILACINFMNLSTARSEKRAKEVGIRMTMGSVRSQLINQFLTESLLVVTIAFFVALHIVLLALPFFNTLAEKRILIPWGNPLLWMDCFLFVVITGLLAGSYPSLVLSSFQPVKVLKGTFKIGKFASVPRKVMVVIQFSVSIALIIGTVVIYQQIAFSKDRPIGYKREGLLQILMKSPEFYSKYDVIRNELKNTGVIHGMSASSTPVTGVWQTENGFKWEGQSLGTDKSDFGTVFVTPDYGKTVNWEMAEGRDFSFTDSASVILNQAAVKFMGIKEPIGMTIQWGKRKYSVVGVVKDMVMESPYKPVGHSIYFTTYDNVNIINISLASDENIYHALAAVGSVFRKHIPSSPFDYKFADVEYAKKFKAEEQIENLASVFAVLAILISCLGLFGLASFIAEQKTKEIGIRKVLGASVTNLWRMLSTDFVVLVLLSCLIAIPISYYFLSDWLKGYEYRTEISWWVFVWSGVGAVFITLLTISFQAIKAAVANPVNSLKSE